jgi:hypothetical protein
LTFAKLALRAEKVGTGRRFSFNVMMALCVLLVITTFVGWPLGREDTGAKGAAEVKNALPKGIPEIETVYAKVKDEIRMRLEHEHELFLYQFFLIGAIVIGLSGLFRRADSNDKVFADMLEKRFLVMTFGVAAIALLIVDIHIRYNAMIMGELGKWIRRYYEVAIPAPAMGWETYWTSSQNYSFYRSAPILFAMLYLPTVTILLGYYALFFWRPLNGLKKNLNILNTMVFIGVQLAVLVFAIINHWPVPRLSWVGWFMVLGWIMSWALVSWHGHRRKRCGQLLDAPENMNERGKK